MYSKDFFDTVYHEHVDFHHVGPLMPFFAARGMRLVQAHRADIHLFVAVRDHFTSNGFTWTAGLDYPDGFKPPRASGWLGLF